VTDSFTLRALTSDDFDTFFEFVQSAFHENAEPSDREAETWIFEVNRAIGIYDGDQQVAAASAFTRDITVPGGPIPIACVTAVAVASTHTRRGLLTRMMRHQLTELHEKRREPVAALWASESAIYGRYGYGVACQHGRLTTSMRDVRLRQPVPPAERRIKVRPAADPKFRAEIAAIYARAAGTRVGFCDRRDRWWDYRLKESNPPRHRIALHDGESGADGYAIYAVRQDWNNQGPQSEVVIEELVTENLDAERALWSYLMNIDLTSHLSWRISPLDAPIRHFVDHPRRVTIDVGDNLWVRIVDVDRALAARTYAVPVDVVFEVTDEFCPWNAGRWRLVGGPDGARCEVTDAEPDLALTTTELGAAYLGGITLGSLARAGLVRELRPGTLRAVSAAFAEPVQPYCPEVF
jgi:predicted acetyltransferase